MVEEQNGVVIHATLVDVYDGVARILGDAQRIGFGLISLQACQMSDGANLTVELSNPLGLDVDQLVWRLKRHPSIVRAAVDRMPTADGADGSARSGCGQSLN